MARIRTVKPEFWTDEKVCALPREVRLTFLGLISAMADDAGRLRGNPKSVRGAIYSLDDDISARDVESHLVQIAAAGLITAYSVKGEPYIAVRNWQRHQKIDRPTPSRLPAPPTGDTTIDIDESSSSPRRSLATERSGVGAEGSGEDRSGADAPARENSPLSLIRDRLVRKFYAGASPDRLREVTKQLEQSLTPEGAKIRGKEFAHARSPEHLSKCVDETIRQGVKDPDKAIVVVLKKLNDPEVDQRGETITEAASSRSKRTTKAEQRERRQLEIAAEVWKSENPEEYSKLEAAAAEKYPGEGPFITITRFTWMLDAITKRIETAKQSVA